MVGPNTQGNTTCARSQDGFNTILYKWGGIVSGKESSRGSNPQQSDVVVA